MARKSNAQLRFEAEQEMAEREAAIAKGIEDRFAALLPTLIATTIAQMGGVKTAEGAPLQVPAGQYDGLAHAIAKAADPGNTRQIIPPEVLEKRQAARLEMYRLIADFHERDKAGEPDAMPIYQVLRRVCLLETMIDPQYHDPVSKKMMDQEINWPGIPNSSLIPLNEPAKLIHAQMMTWTGQETPDISKEGAPVVMDGNRLFRGKSGTQHLQAAGVDVGAAPDPRRHVPGATTKRQAVLGTLHSPAVVGP